MGTVCGFISMLRTAEHQVIAMEDDAVKEPDS